jgi:hypothetical protein
VLSFGVASKPLLDPAKDGIVSSLGCPPLLSFSEVGESSRGGGLEELGGPPMVAIDLSLCFQALGVSHEGNEKDILDFMALFNAEHRLEDPVSIPKFKRSREVKNLDCTINYDARGFGSKRGKARGLLM